MKFLDLAVAEALQRRDGDPCRGAVLVKRGRVVAGSGDRTRLLNDPIATAEMNCIRQAGRRHDQSELTLYATDYPDMLAAGTVLQFSIGAMVIGLPRIDRAEIHLLESRGTPVTFIVHEQCRNLKSGAR